MFWVKFFSTGTDYWTKSTAEGSTQQVLTAGQSITENLTFSLSLSLSLRLQLHLSPPLPTFHPAGLQHRWKFVNRGGRLFCRIPRDRHKCGEEESFNHIIWYFCKERSLHWICLVVWVKADGGYQIVHCCPLCVSVPYVLKDTGFITLSLSK